MRGAYKSTDTAVVISSCVFIPGGLDRQYCDAAMRMTYLHKALGSPSIECVLYLPSGIW